MSLKNVFLLIRLSLYLIIYLVLYLIPLTIIEMRSICIFFNAFGVKCLGCGLTRAFFNMAHFKIYRAINYNSLILIIFPIFVILTIDDGIIIIKRIFKIADYNKKSIIEKILCKLYK